MTNLLWSHRRLFSFGGGTQSIAVLIAQGQGLLAEPYDYFVWADVGADSEEPHVHDYMARYVVPFAVEHGINLVRVAKQYRGADDTVLSSLMRNNRSIPIPVRMSNGAPTNRSCTYDFKIKQVDDWARRCQFTHITVGLGLSIDESRRVDGKPTSWVSHQPRNKNVTLLKRFDFPLFALGFNRGRSIEFVRSAGFPPPPRSACWFCPFKSRYAWIEDKRLRVDIVQNAALVEAIINRKRGSTGRDKVYIHPPASGNMHLLSSAIGDQLSLFEDVCDSGYCGL